MLMYVAESNIVRILVTKLSSILVSLVEYAMIEYTSHWFIQYV